jgi:hypothetical protein
MAAWKHLRAILRNPEKVGGGTWTATFGQAERRSAA